jgi:hypothetical protein
VGQAQAPIWNVPYQRNLLFTGREDVLKRLNEALRADKTAALAQPQAISGLGGIGKTQTAVEYAYLNRDDYQAILWVKAETAGSIISDFVTIAQLLNLPEQQEQEQLHIVEAVKRWFQEQNCCASAPFSPPMPFPKNSSLKALPNWVQRLNRSPPTHPASILP